MKIQEIIEKIITTNKCNECNRTPFEMMTCGILAWMPKLAECMHNKVKEDQDV